jgi:hypothetical protein
MGTVIFLGLLIIGGIILIALTRSADGHGVIAALIIYGILAIIVTIGVYELVLWLIENVSIVWGG